MHAHTYMHACKLLPTTPNHYNIIKYSTGEVAVYAKQPELCYLLPMNRSNSTSSDTWILCLFAKWQSPL